MTYYRNPITLSLTTLSIFLVALFGFGLSEQQRYKESLRAHTTKNLSQIRATLEGDINANIHLTRGLLAFIATHPNINQTTFHKIATNLLSYDNSIINIGLAPDNILSFIHPVKDNEKALGFDYTSSQAQWPAVKTAIKEKRTVVAGPVQLIQGGKAFICRSPIYIGGHDEKEYYWGMASIVLDQQKIFANAGIHNTELDIEIAIRGKDGTGKDGEIFSGSPSLFNNQPVLLDVILPEGSWQLAAIPQGGWNSRSPHLIWINLLGIFLSLISSFGIFFWINKLNMSQEAVEQARQKAEQATGNMRKNKRFLQAIIENIPLMIFVKEAKELRFVTLNKAGEELLGHKSINMIGKNDYDFFPKEQAAFFTAKDREVLHNRQRIDIAEEIIHTHHKGDRFLHTKKIPILDETGEPVFLLGISDDITERKTTEKSLLESEARFKALHNASFGGIIIHDKGLIIDCNKGLCDMTGYSMEELIGMDGLHLINSHTRPLVIKNITLGYEAPYEAVGLRKNGEEFPVRIEARNIPYKGRVVRVVEFRDITARKQGEAERELLQEQLKQAQKMEAIGTLAGGIAHDFNNMLGGIVGASEMLSIHLEKNSNLKKYNDIIRQSADRASTLTKQLLAFSRTGPRASNPVDLHEVITESLVLIQNGIDKRIKLETKITAEKSIIIGDPAQLQSMFLNLRINSAHAMPNGGKIIIRTRQCYMSKTACTESGFKLTPGEYIEIQVQDNGEGIGKEYLGKIFDPFFTTKKLGKGTGLGLSSVYGTTLQHSGAILVESKLNKGTIFTLLFPLSHQKEDQSRPPVVSDIIRGQGCILIVDDEEVLRITAEELVKDMGYKVLSATDGKNALDIFKENHATIDLVLLDMMMPVMNGKDCFYAMKKEKPDVQVILTSGFIHEDDLHAMQNDGLASFIRKPYNMADLNTAISQHLIPRS